MAARSWKSSDPLFRGDDATGVRMPAPEADDSIVRHILYLGGAGRESPYLSTTEDRPIAKRFAGRRGRVFETLIRNLKAEKVGHISKGELLHLLKGTGHGRAKWPRAFEVLRARQYVERHLEHLADFSPLALLEDDELTAIVRKVFQ